MSRRAAVLVPGAVALIAAIGLAWPGASNSALLVILITTVAAVVVSASALVSLRRITEGARRFAAGDLSHTIEGKHPSTTTELVAALNNMARELSARFESASQEQSRLTAALDSSIDAVVAVGANDRITFANLAAKRLFMRSREELVGAPFVWIMPNEQVIEALHKSHEEGRSEMELSDQPNKRQLHVITAPIAGGGDWSALAIFHDLTEVRRIERVRRDFVANVSHELRTPVASIKAVIETLQAGALDDREAAEDFLGRADQEVDRLAQMVEELLELSRIESGDVPLRQEAVDLISVVARAVDRLRAQSEKQSVRLALDAKAAVGQVTGDSELLERAVVNLVSNAIKFSPPGGSVDVRVERTADAVTVSVADTGSGIDPEDIPRVFERFYKADRSRHGGGTGLGLALVKHTVEAHGGTVTVRSDRGRGSTFTFTIPSAS